jgi:hypothetical protein
MVVRSALHSRSHRRRKTYETRHFFVLLLASLIVLFTGCSAVGYLVGSGIDNGREKKPRTFQDIGMLNNGDSVEIRLTNGGIVKGKFVSTHVMSYAESRARLVQSDTQVPDSGEHVSLFLNRPVHKVISVIVLGFAEDEPKIDLTYDKSTRRFQLRLSDIDTLIDSRGNAIAVAKLEHLSQAGCLPLHVLWMRAGGLVTEFGMDEIDTMIWGPSGHARYIGRWIGAAVDVGVIVTACILISHFRGGALGPNLSGNWDFFGD